MLSWVGWLLDTSRKSQQRGGLWLHLGSDDLIPAPAVGIWEVDLASEVLCWLEHSGQFFINLVICCDTLGHHTDMFAHRWYRWIPWYPLWNFPKVSSYSNTGTTIQQPRSSRFSSSVSSPRTSRYSLAWGLLSACQASCLYSIVSREYVGSSL